MSFVSGTVTQGQQKLGTPKVDQQYHNFLELYVEYVEHCRILNSSLVQCSTVRQSQSSTRSEDVFTPE